MVLRLVRFVPRGLPDSAPRWGAWREDGVVELPDPAPSLDLLRCAAALDGARRAAEQPATFSTGEVRLLCPLPQPGKLLCVASNYREHIREGGRIDGSETDAATPWIFLKPTSNAVCGPDDPILIPRSGQFVDYEGELAVVIGRRGKHIPAADALEYVGGITCCNDISERQLKIWERPEDRPWDKFFDWLNGKWYDNSLPLGPALVPLGEVGDLHDLRLQTRVNGERVQDSSTGAMIFRVERLIEYISAMMTLEPGDVIATGTPAGVGSARGAALQAGDVVEVQIDPIGTLRNPVALE